MQIKKIEILALHIDNLKPNDVVTIVDTAIIEKRQIHLEGVNAGKIVDMQRDQMLYKSVVNSKLITADGQSVVWASRFLNKPLYGRLAGIDLMYKFIDLAFQKEYTIFLFGAKESVIDKLVNQYSKKYSPNIIAGYRNGYFNNEEAPQIAKQIADSKANMLFVGITSPIKEHFLFEHKQTLKEINLIMGVGGSFDVASGLTKRAPLWMQDIGFEWFWRFLQEPKRLWKRYLIGNSKFMLMVLKDKFAR